MAKSSYVQEDYSNGEAAIDHHINGTHELKSDSSDQKKNYKRSSVVARLIDAFEKAVIWSFYPDASKPLHFLQGNYAPVPEQKAPTPYLPVTGTIPVHVSVYM